MKTINKAEIELAWLGVVGSRLTLDRLLSEAHSWWCLPPNVKIGNILLMYCTSQCSKTHQGIFGIFEVSLIDTTKASECSRFGSFGGVKLNYVELNKVSIFGTTLKLSYMKKDAMLSTAQFVRRNCQGTYFSISQRELTQIKKLLSPIQS